MTCAGSPSTSSVTCSELEHVPRNTLAIVVRVTSHIDTIQADDVAGVESIYGVRRPPRRWLPAR